MTSPFLELVRPWLPQAELSVPLDGTDRYGLSLYAGSADTFRKLCETLSAPPSLVAQEQTVRSWFDVAPRHWLKLDLRGRQVTGYSQYWQLDPTLHYAATTLRVFLRRLGQAEVGWVEPGFLPALEDRGTSWVLALKQAGTTPRPRLCCRLASRLLTAVLTRLVEAAKLTEPVAAEYATAVSQHPADWVYLSLDPDEVDACSLDLVEPEGVALLPWTQFAGEACGRPRYLKLRVAPVTLRPAWKAYLPLQAVLEAPRDGVCRGLLDQLPETTPTAPGSRHAAAPSAPRA